MNIVPFLFLKINYDLKRLENKKFADQNKLKCFLLF